MTCQLGQGQSGGQIIKRTSQNDEAACLKQCRAISTCFGFDYQTAPGDDACRLFKVNKPRIGNGGGNNRRYCAIPDREQAGGLDFVDFADFIIDCRLQRQIGQRNRLSSKQPQLKK